MQKTCIELVSYSVILIPLIVNTSWLWSILDASKCFCTRCIDKIPISNKKKLNKTSCLVQVKKLNKYSYREKLSVFCFFSIPSGCLHVVNVIILL